jgi:hypothetical protein
MNNNFLKLLKNTAKEQSFLSKEKLIPDPLSDVANLIATHLWQSILVLSFLSTVLLNLYQFLKS